MGNEARAAEPQRPPRAGSSRAAADRDRGLLRIGRVNHWLIGGAIVMTGFLSTVAALAHPGSSRRNSTASPTGAGSQSSTSGANGSAGSSDSNSGANDPNSGYVDPNSGYDQSGAPSDPSQVPAAPSAVPQAVPDQGLPPAATSGGS